MKVLAVKIHKSLKDSLKDPNRQNVKECTRKYWKCSKKRRNEIGAIIGIKDGTIYSAFDVISCHDSNLENGRTEFICGNSIDSLLGYSLKSSKKPATILYYDMEEIEKEIKFDEELNRKREEYLKVKKIPYE